MSPGGFRRGIWSQESPQEGPWESLKQTLPRPAGTKPWRHHPGPGEGRSLGSAGGHRASSPFQAQTGHKPALGQSFGLREGFLCPFQGPRHSFTETNQAGLVHFFPQAPNCIFSPLSEVSHPFLNISFIQIGKKQGLSLKLTVDARFLVC